jgi:hypothetical protein
VNSELELRGGVKYDSADSKVNITNNGGCTIHRFPTTSVTALYPDACLTPAGAFRTSPRRIDACEAKHVVLLVEALAETHR